MGKWEDIGQKVQTLNYKLNTFWGYNVQHILDDEAEICSENISHASKVMLKISQARLQQYMNSELPDFQDRYGKGRVTRD